MLKNKIKAFTLAEVMVVMGIIGILAGILMPVINASRPDENVMKFKKANTTLGNVIRELVSSDQYYFEGDLGRRKLAEGEEEAKYIDGTHSGDYSYFCETFADMLSTKSVNCKTAKNSLTSYWLTSNESISTLSSSDKITKTVTDETIAATKAKFDSVCKTNAATMGEEIVTSDGIIYYEAGTAKLFGENESTNITGTCLGSGCNGTCGTINMCSGSMCTTFDTYGISHTASRGTIRKNNTNNCQSQGKVLCTISTGGSFITGASSPVSNCKVTATTYSDGGTNGSSITISGQSGSRNINGSTKYYCYTKYTIKGCGTESKHYTLRTFSPPNEAPAFIGDTYGYDIAYRIMCVDVDGIGTGEDPFGYGIRADGKIMPGERADEWLEKDFQKGKKDNE